MKRRDRLESKKAPLRTIASPPTRDTVLGLEASINAKFAGSTTRVISVSLRQPRFNQEQYIQSEMSQPRASLKQPSSQRVHCFLKDVFLFIIIFFIHLSFFLHRELSTLNQS